MTQSVSRRGVRQPGSSGPSGHALDLVRSALDVAELLVQHVIRPALQQAEPAGLHQGDRRGGDAAAAGRPGARRRGRPGADRRTRLEDQPYRALPLRPHRRSPPAPRGRPRTCSPTAACTSSAAVTTPSTQLARAALTSSARTPASGCPTACSTSPGSGTCCSATTSSTIRALETSPIVRGRRPGRDDRSRTRTRSATRCPTPPTSAAARCRPPSTRPGCRASPTRWCSRRSTRTTSTCSGSC